MTNTNAKSAQVVDLNARKKAGEQGAKKGAKCPLCAKPVVTEYRPFCSKRCADLDLGKWLGEGYRIPTMEGPGDGENDIEGFDEQD